MRELPFEHQQSVRVPADIRMHSHGKDKVVILSIKVLELVHPQVFHVARIHPSVTV